jgi:hypothetical protein
MYNVYQLKFKLIPSDKKFKPSTICGVVVEKTRELAIEMARKNLAETLKNDPMNLTIKIESATTLKSDFFYINTKEDASN